MQTATNEAPPTAEAVTAKIIRETLTGDLRDFLLAEAKEVKSSLPWHLRSEADQREVIESATRLSIGMVDRMVKIIAADGRPTMVGTLKKVTSNGETIEAVLRVNKSDPLRHALADAVGMDVLVVVAASDIYTGEQNPAFATPDQSGMFEDGHDGDGVFDNTPFGKG